ncbi:MAG: ankyrin repeat domain-containing protein [Akkermansia sp.]|nr:ankyrin repeat domain-containing protein [Akkermansia sp.]
MSETAIQSYLHSLLRCPIEDLPAYVEAEVPAEVQSWLSASAEREQDFYLLMAAARQEPYITEYAWEISHVLEYFGADDDYGWKELMGCVDAVGIAIDEKDSVREQLGMAIIRLLLEAGDSPNNDYAIALYSGPLHYACQEGYLQLAELLLRYGADPDMEDADMQTPLHFAAKHNHPDCAELLLEFGAFVDAPDIAGWTPLRSAILRQHENMVALLQKHGAHITEYTEKDWDLYMKTHKISHN